MYRDEKINGIDDCKIAMTLWLEVEKPKGVIQLFHGMAEHIKRYKHFANYLNQQGYIVIGHDHRSYGESKKENLPYGYLGKNGFHNVVEEGYLVNQYIKDKYPKLPIILFAHSFGSFVAQNYICKYGESINGLILSGSAKQDGLDISAAYMIAKIQKKLYGDVKEGKLLEKLSFGAFNNNIKPSRTAFDWLSSKEESVDKYIDDPMCGNISPINFYVEFLKGLKKTYDKETLKKIPKNLPILILSGQEDPVGKYGHSLIKLESMYKTLQQKDVTLKLFEGCRHELINEVNYMDVFEYLGQWINSKVN